MTEGIRVLLLEDNPDDAGMVQELVLRSKASQVEWTHVFSLGNGLDQLKRDRFDAALVDLSLPDSQGLDTLLAVLAEAPALPIVVLTGHAQDATAQQAIEKGAQDYVTKWPKDGQSITRAIHYAIERKRSVEALRASEARYRSLVQTAGSVILSLSSEGRILEWNRAAESVYGWRREEVLDKDYFGLCLPEAARAAVVAEFRKVLAGEPSRGFENSIRSRNGGERTLLWNVTSLPNGSAGVKGVIAIGQGVTEQRKVESQLRQAQKMEAVGHLAGGIAHDLNNLLTIITGYSELVISGLHAEDPSGELLREVCKAGTRAAALTRQLLAFSRKQILEPVVLDLNFLVTELEKMLRRLIGEDIDLATVLDPGLGRVKADPGQIEQVIINLAVNARDAMPTGGKFTIETRTMELDESFTHRHQEISPGSYVMLAVTDTGCGMDQATQARIFEPFFTTKEPGKGTGLGLATVYGIVKQSGGFIYLYSEPGLGTTFKIYLPQVRTAVPSGLPASWIAPVPSGTETVLLAEDEEGVRALARLGLQSSGYMVLEAHNGEEAVRIGQEHSGPIHLLVTDVVMPKMGGRQLAERLAPLRPDMKVMYLSGYTDDAVVRHGVLEADRPFLQKPFTPTSLARKVRQVLDERPQPLPQGTSAPR